MLPPVRVVVEVLPSPHVLKMNFLRKKRKQLYFLLVCYKKQIIDVILLLRFFCRATQFFASSLTSLVSPSTLWHINYHPAFVWGAHFFSYSLPALTPLEGVLYSSNIKRHVMNIMSLQQNS